MLISDGVKPLSLDPINFIHNVSFTCSNSDTFFVTNITDRLNKESKLPIYPYLSISISLPIWLSHDVSLLFVVSNDILVAKGYPTITFSIIVSMVSDPNTTYTLSTKD